MSNQTSYDIAIVGAGPAGLSAARTLARLGFRTVVVERQPAPGRLDHPQPALLVPMPGFVNCEQRLGRIYYPELDLRVPDQTVLGRPTLQQYISPGGKALQAHLGKSARSVAITIDKRAFLECLADEAAAAGAELQFGRAATGLLRSGRVICGLATSSGDMDVDLVLSAEGVARSLAVEAGLYEARSASTYYAVTLTQEMGIPDCWQQEVGQVSTFGRRYSSATRGFGMVTFGAPGRLAVSYTIFSDRPVHYTDPALWAYLDEYVDSDDRIRGFLAGGQILQRTGHRRTITNAPDHVVRDGFLAAGDAVLGGEHGGVLSALYVGRTAALVAAEALEAGDLSASALLPYAQFFCSKVSASLQAGSRALWELTGMTDEEINRLFTLLVRIHSAEQFFSTWETAPWVAGRWLAEKTALVGEDVELLSRFCTGTGAKASPEEREAVAWGQSRPLSVAQY